MTETNDGSPYATMLGIVMDAFDCSRVTARRRLKQLEDAGYIQRPQVSGRGAPKKVVLTDHGRDFLHPGAQWKYPASMKHLAVRPMKVNKPKPTPRQNLRPQLQPQTLANRPNPISESTRIERLFRQVERHQIGSYPRISFEGTERKKFLQLLTPLDEIQTSSIQVYEQIKVARTSAGLPILRTVIDTTWTTIYGEEIGEDPFGERFEGQFSKHRFLGVAVLLEPVETGFDLARIENLDEQTGELRSVPAIGLVLEAIAFWQPPFDQPHLYDGRVFQVVRHGPRHNRSFTFSATEDAVDLDAHADAIIDRDAVIREWSDVQAQRGWVEQMPPEWVPYIVRDPFSQFSDAPR